jgi:hypothetical protein
MSISSLLSNHSLQLLNPITSAKPGANLGPIDAIALGAQSCVGWFAVFRETAYVDKTTAQGSLTTNSIGTCLKFLDIHFKKGLLKYL